MKPVNNPHDKFIKELFSNKEKAKDFLVNFTPEPVLRLIDLESIEIVKDSFIDDELEEYFSDILYKVNLANNPGYIYFLFEHKSTYYKPTPLQLLGYMVQIWKLVKRQEPNKGLPLIIPQVIYHGKEKWTQETRFFPMMEDVPEELKSYVPDFEYILYNLCEYSDSELHGMAGLSIGLLLLKYIFEEGAFKDKLEKIFSLFREIENQESGLDLFRTVIRYILSAAEGISIKDLQKIAEQKISKQTGGTIMTIAEQLRQEGVQQGIQQGMQQGIQQGMQTGGLEKARGFVLEALELRFGEVPGVIKARVEGIDRIEVLEKLHREAIIADSEEQFKRVLSETDRLKH